MRTSKKRPLKIAAVLGSLMAVVLLVLSLVPYSSLKPLADHLAPDGDLESFSTSLARQLRTLWAVTACILLCAATWALVRSDDALRVHSQIRRQVLAWLKDMGRFRSDLRHLRLNGGELAGLIAISGVGLAARLILINRPIEYDEAYTVMAFAHSPFHVLVSDYHVPNNHVFHTILVRIAVLLLGSEPWQIRIPVLLGGMFLIPFVFWLGRALYTREVGLLSAAIVAFLPHLVEKSVSARGYILVAMLTVIAFLLVYYLARRRNLFGWSLLVVVSALGFYTLPVMLFPFGFMLAWMVMSTPNAGDGQYTRSGWFLHVAVSGLLVGLLTLALYSPILFTSGFRYVFPPSGVLHGQTVMELVNGLPELTGQVVAAWSNALNPILRGAYLLGMLLCVAGLVRGRNRRGHTLMAFLASVLVLLLMQRPIPLGRIWLWVVPFAAIWISSGLVDLLQWFRRFRQGQWLTGVVLAGFVVVLAATGIRASYQRITDNAFEHPATRDVARFLAPRLGPRSMLVMDYAWDAYIWYYLYLEGVERPFIFHPNKDRPFDEVLALVATWAATCDDAEVYETLAGFGPDLAKLNLDAMRELAQIDFMKICWLPSLVP